MLHLDRGVAFEYNQRRTEGDVQGQFLLSARWRVRQRLEQLDCQC